MQLARIGGGGGVAIGLHDELSSLIMIIWWQIWRVRNNRIFNNRALSFLQVCDSITNELTTWRLAGVKGALDWRDVDHSLLHLYIYFLLFQNFLCSCVPPS
jgi:hypothetical protein